MSGLKLIRAAPFALCAVSSALMVSHHLAADHKQAQQHMVNSKTVYYSLLWATIALLWNNLRLLSGILFGSKFVFSSVTTFGQCLFAFSYPVLALVSLELVCMMYNLPWLAWFSDMILPTLLFIGANCFLLDLLGHTEYTEEGDIPRYTVVNKKVII